MRFDHFLSPKNWKTRPGAAKESRAKKARKGRGKRLAVESLENRVLLAGDVASPWHNDQLSGDVNGDGVISPIDVLTILNELNAGGPRALASADGFISLGGESESPTQSDPPFVDANADNFLTSSDALAALGAMGEGETLENPDHLARIAGVAYADSLNDGFTPDDGLVAGATVNLYLDDGDGLVGAGDTLIGTQTTDPAGQYLFVGLNAGSYIVEQEPVVGLLQDPADRFEQIEITAEDADGSAIMVIDSFDTFQEVIADSSNGRFDSSAIAAAEAIGGERDMMVDLTSTLGLLQLRVNHDGGLLLQYDSSAIAMGRRLVSWDGADGDGATLDPTGLGGMDLTENGAFGIAMKLGADQGAGVATLRIYSDANNWSVASFPIPNTGGLASETIAVPFTDLITGAGSGADLTNVGAIELEIEGIAAVDGQVDLITTIAPSTLDANFRNHPMLTVGDLVWNDIDNDGFYSAATEPTLAGVVVNLFDDTDSSNDFSPGTDILLATTTTNANGNYRFDGLTPGDYVVQIAQTNFDVGGSLEGMQSSTGIVPTADPDNDHNIDDNGDPFVGHGVVAKAVTLTIAGEPITEDGLPNTNLTVDFGMNDAPDPTLNLGDLVWNDLNNNGLYDTATETGLAEVVVNLFADTDQSGDLTPGVDQLVGTTTTDATGEYLFTELTPGNYIVQLDPSNFLAGGSLDNMQSSTGNEPTPDPDNNVDDDDNGDPMLGQGIVSQTITLSIDHEPFDGIDDFNTNRTLDFGLFESETPETLSLGDLVWEDFDNNGFYNAATEPGIAGVTVNLYEDTDGSNDFTPNVDLLLHSTITNAAGNYLFSELTPGDYVVQIDPVNFIVGGPLEGKVSSTGNEPTPDPDGDSLNNDDGDPMLGHGIVSQAVTLSLGDETILDDGDPNTNLTVDFGLFGVDLLTLGDIVWNDTDNNGFYDTVGESGIADVVLNLYLDVDTSNDYTPGVDLFVATTTSDANGSYQFGSLLAGDYVVQIAPENFIVGGPLEGMASSTGNEPTSDPDDNVNSDDNGDPMAGHGVVSQAVTLEFGQEPAFEDDNANTNMTIDFGFFATELLIMGDLVWNDVNNDGIFSSSTEAGISGVLLNLFADTDGNGEFTDGVDTMIAGTVTDASGIYIFSALMPGDYIVQIHPINFEPGGVLEGMQSSTGNDPTPDPDDDINNDDNGNELPGPGTTNKAVTLTFGGEPTNEDGNLNSNMTIDFGFFRSDAVRLGDLVWIDLNGNGQFDPGSESGISGVFVNLFIDSDGSNDYTPGTDARVESTTTDANGNYVFSDLTSGDYIVQIDAANFEVGGALENLESSGGLTPAVDPDNDVNSDDNGTPMAGHGVVSLAVTLIAGDEPINEDGDSNSNLTVDFGFTEPQVIDNLASVSGFVYLDFDDDGLINGSDVGLAEVEVRLSGVTDAGVAVELMQLTAEDGSYGFYDLLPGVYNVIEIQPEPFVDGKDTQGTPQLGTTHDDFFAQLDLRGGTHAEDYNFGELLPGKRQALA